MFVNYDILGVPISNITLNDAVKHIASNLNRDDYNNKQIIFTPNPEFVINALNDDEFMEILNKSSFNIPDGIGIIIASKILGHNINNRLPGFDLVQAVFEDIQDKDITVYFLGSSEENINKAKSEMQKKYKNLKIIGCRNGYFKSDEDNIIIQEINSLSPDLLLVGLGSPRQEKWIYNNKDKLKAKVMIGVGGSFDVMSGNVKRAPEFFIKYNLEWFYRLITQPKRFIRMLKLPLFLIKVIIFKLFKIK
ncbi:MAG: WecB/TagA/CpsF family glycosyltransferase [bacterium]